MYWWEGFMKYAVKVGPGDMIYIPIFVTISLGNTFLEPVVLVLWSRWIYEVSSWDGLKWNCIESEFHDDRLRQSNNIKDVALMIWETAALEFLMGFMKYAVKMTSGGMIYMYIRVYQVSRRSAQAFKSCCGGICIQTHTDSEVIS
jgi:hypothetical protein